MCIAADVVTAELATTASANIATRDQLKAGAVPVGDHNIFDDARESRCDESWRASADAA